MQFSGIKTQAVRFLGILIGLFLLVPAVLAKDGVTAAAPFDTVVFLSSSSQALTSGELEGRSGAISLGPQPGAKALAYLGSKYGVPLDASNVRTILDDLRSIYNSESGGLVQLSVLKPFDNSTALQIIIDERDRNGVIQFSKRKPQPAKKLSEDQLAALAARLVRENKPVSPDDATISDNGFLAKNIRAIVLVSDPSFYDIDSSYPHEGVRDFGARPPPGLLSELDKFIGKNGEASVPLLQKITNEAYAAGNRPGVQIWIDPKFPSTGILKILISPKQADMATFTAGNEPNRTDAKSDVNANTIVEQSQSTRENGIKNTDINSIPANWILGKISVTGEFKADSAQIAESLNLKSGERVNPENLASAFKALNKSSDTAFEFRYEQVSLFPPVLNINIVGRNRIAAKPPVTSQNQQRLNAPSPATVVSNARGGVPPAYRLGQYRVTGAERTGVSNIIARLTTAPGEIIDRKILKRDLGALNRSSNRTVTLAFERVAGKPYVLDIALSVHEGKKTRVFSSINNDGVSRNAETLVDAGFQINTLGYWDQTFLYRYNGESNFDAIDGHYFRYSAILGSGHQFDATAQYNESQSSTTTSARNAFSQEQESTTFGVRYTVPVLLNEGGLSADTYVGLIAKDRQFQTELNNAPQNNLQNRIYQISPGLKVSKVGQNYSVSIDGKFTISPGEIDSLNTNAAFRVERLGTSAAYVYANISGNLTYKFLQGWSVKSNFNTQITNDRLLSSERLSAGGNSTVRGFDSGSASGDLGAVGSVELHLPSIEQSFSAGRKATLQPFLFLDGAILDFVDARSDEPGAGLLSAGAGIEYHVGENFQLSANAGWQLVDRNTFDQNSARFYFGGSLKF